jgi:hypothetical protein
MKKTSLYLSAFLLLVSGTYIQASLPSTAPIKESQDPTNVKCIEACKVKTGGGLGVSCEQMCGVQKIPEIIPPTTNEPNAPVTPTLPNISTSEITPSHPPQD